MKLPIALASSFNTLYSTVHNITGTGADWRSPARLACGKVCTYTRTLAQCCRKAAHTPTPAREQRLTGGSRSANKNRNERGLQHSHGGDARLTCVVLRGASRRRPIHRSWPVDEHPRVTSSTPWSMPRHPVTITGLICPDTPCVP